MASVVRPAPVVNPERRFDLFLASPDDLGSLEHAFTGSMVDVLHWTKTWYAGDTCDLVVLIAPAERIYVPKKAEGGAR